jgi:hypothetical protein
MPILQCSCGFAETADETLTDHLLAAFTPEDCRGADGQVHEEGELGRCLCGVAVAAPGALDDHFLAVFTPVGSIGRDDTEHQPADAGDGPSRSSSA